MKNLKLIFITVAISLFISSGRVSSGELPEINKQIDQLELGSSSFEDAVRVFGEPTQYIWGNRTFTKDILPEVFIAFWKDRVNILINRGTIHEIRISSPRSKYLFMGRIGIGSRLEDVLEVVGQPKETVVNKPGYKDGVLYKDREGRKGTCYYARADKNVRMFFRNYKLISIFLTRGIPNTGSGTLHQKVTPVSSVKDFDDVRFRDLSKLDLTDRRGLIQTLTFSTRTVWPAEDKLSSGRNPRIVMKEAMNPGLGIRQIHEQGITGKGINVAIIDQPLYLDHPEYKGKIVEYFDTGCGSESSMHGPAVASLLVGTNCGTAPGAKLYYAAAPSWNGDSAYYAKALDWIMEKNAGLADGDKIRAVSVSAAPSGQGSPFDKNHHLWEQARSRALEKGILVLDCTRECGFISCCWYDPNDPEDVTKCSTGFPDTDQHYRPDQLQTPCSIRTTAEHYEKDEFSYQYWGRGGLSWGIPYATGVLALGWQINPDLSADKAKELLFESAYSTADGGKIINPGKFVELAKSTRSR